ncbi:hypothetical protein ACFE04_005742 [Oxalis oulophora]
MVLDVESSNISELYFPNFFYKRLELATEFQGVTTGKEIEIVRKMILVGLWCIQTNPSDRPAISRVIEMLEGNIGVLGIPPRPFLSSPPRSPPQHSMSESTSTMSPNSYAAQKDYSICIEDYSCGNATFGYPFSGDELPDYCGHPGFNLSCQIDNSGGNFSVIDMDGMRFRVVEINESANRMRLARIDLWKLPCTNDGLANNTKLDYSIIDFVENVNENLTLFYACSEFQSLDATLAPDYFNCSGNGDTFSSIYYVRESLLGNYTVNSWFSECYKKSIKVPVLNINVDKLVSSNLQSSINGGFDVQYTNVGKTCQNCASKDGLCLYVNNKFLCTNQPASKRKNPSCQ